MDNRVTAALVLAGGGSPPELAEATGCSERALIEVGGVPMMAHVLRALDSLAEIRTIAVAGSNGVLDVARVECSGREIIEVPAGARMVDNLRAGISALRDAYTADGAAFGSVLVCTCDIPLVTHETFQELLVAAQNANLELAYPIVSRAVSEATFPGGNRTYARLRGGEYTGGNAVIVPARIVDDVAAMVDSAYNARKNPAALARMLGAGLMLKFATKRLAIGDVEQRASQLLNCRAGAVQMKDATIAFDVDKLHDLNVVRSKLES